MIADEDRCLHDMVKGTCGICDAPRPRRTLKQEGPSRFRHPGDGVEVEAKYDGYCKAGGDHISVGETITYSDEHDSFVHPECI